MNKLRASTWAYTKGPGAKLKDKDGGTWELLEDGDFLLTKRGVYQAQYACLYGTYAPFSIIEPEKTNEELAKEADDFWIEPGREGCRRAFKFIFDVVDQKIRGSK